MIKLRCLCCGHVETFSDAEKAFQAGWDAPPHFTLTCCNLCPASYLTLGISHEEVHERWKREGRPKEFGPDCVNSDHLAFFGGA